MRGLRRMRLPAAVLDPSGQASPAEGQPCRMGAASFMVARARGRARRGQIGNTATTLAKPRPNSRACGRQYLRSAIWATRYKAPHDPHRTRASISPEAARVGHGYRPLRLTLREETTDNSLVIFERWQNIGENRRGSRSPPTTVNSSVRTREYLTTAEIERLMAAARKSTRYGHRDATMVLIGYRHGLRASELCDLQWSQVELATGPATCPQGEERLRVSTQCRATRYAPCGACSANRGCPCTSL
jgi:integrase